MGQDFTVANWDQRGSAKTFGHNDRSAPDLTLDRLVDDAIEVAEHVRNRLSLRKVILVGQSWGSFLGVNVIKRFTVFSAFVGTGQVVSLAATMAERVRWTRQQAMAVGDQATLKALDSGGLASGSEPVEVCLFRGSFDLTAALLDFEQSAPFALDLASADASVVASLFANSAGAKGDAADWLAGQVFSGQKLEIVSASMDIRTLGLDMPIPTFVIQGREDHIVGFEPPSYRRRNSRAC